MSSEPAIHLTRKEKEVLTWAALGKSAEETAWHMGVTARAVENHFYRINKKLNARTKAQAVALAIAHRFIHLPGKNGPGERN